MFRREPIFPFHFPIFHSHTVRRVNNLRNPRLNFVALLQVVASLGSANVKLPARESFRSLDATPFLISGIAYRSGSKQIHMWRRPFLSANTRGKPWNGFSSTIRDTSGGSSRKARDCPARLDRALSNSCDGPQACVYRACVRGVSCAR
jgi:hypothetical protein